MRKLDGKSIFVRDLSKNKQLSGYMRMNIGTITQTKRLLKKLTGLFSIKAVFLDRDGTLIEEPDGASEEEKVMGDISKLRILPHAIGGTKAIASKGYSIFVISNQDGINRGLLSLSKYEDLNRFIDKQLKQNGVLVTKWGVCPHTPEEKCSCRKPATGLVDSVAKDYSIDFKKSYVIGDRESDISLGKKLGMKTILVKRNEGTFSSSKIKPTLYASDLHDAARKLQTLE
jgi:D-glycero-D-manno-heptose 1,7-bisphosphate phosphatase